MFKKLSNIKYDRHALLDIAENINYSDGYKELGRTVPQQVHPAFDIKNPYVKQILQQFKMPNIFYSSSFIRTQPNSVVEAHEDSASGDIIRTVNILFPLKNYDTPLNFYEKNVLKDSVIIDCPVAFDCSVMHGYENKSDGWRLAFLLQCRQPFTFEKLVTIGAI